MSRLTKQSLEFARRHVIKYYDSDFFPKPFEFYAIWHYWEAVKEHLLGLELSGISPRPLRVQAAPRPGGGYRIVHQLDPLNALAYTAQAFLVAPAIERRRMAPETRVACSYRIDVDYDAGTFFRSGPGFNAFVEKSTELASQFAYVLQTDITDFYNQIYLHRVQNAIAAADPSLEALATEVEGFLTRLNNRISQGVPVGPAASIIMAEAILTDVDDYIRNKGFKHTRYVDDFRIFANSDRDLDRLTRDLLSYLYSNHRLTLATGKTSILTTGRFLSHVIGDPDQVERQEIHRRLEAVVRVPRYDFLADGDPVRDERAAGVAARTEALQSLMQRVCDTEPLDLGLARHVLRRCRGLRLRTIVPQLLSNFGKFAPVINDVVLYLVKVTNASFLERNGPILIDLVSHRAMDTPLVATWFLEYIARQEVLAREPAVQTTIYGGDCLRCQATLAYTTRNVAWVRQYRDRLGELGAWDRRQVVRAARLLPRDERSAWLSNIAESSDDPLERWVAGWAAR